MSYSIDGYVMMDGSASLVSSLALQGADVSMHWKCKSFATMKTLPRTWKD
jgi:hypothetical protein